MEMFKGIVAVAFLAASTSPIFAQRPAVQPPRQRPATQPAPQTSIAVPDAKIALINTDVFFDEKQGIMRLVSAIRRVEGEFQTTNGQLQQLQQQIQKAEGDLKQVLARQDQKVSQQQGEKIEEMKKKLKRDTEDAQARYQKKIQEVLAPIQEDIGRALDAYAKAHAITLILDVTKMGQAILTASDGSDITRPFILEFNSQNPATASAAPAPPGKP